MQYRDESILETALYWLIINKKCLKTRPSYDKTGVTKLSCSQNLTRIQTTSQLSTHVIKKTKQNAILHTLSCRCGVWVTSPESLRYITWATVSSNSSFIRWHSHFTMTSARSTANLRCSTVACQHKNSFATLHCKRHSISQPTVKVCTTSRPTRHFISHFTEKSLQARSLLNYNVTKENNAMV